MGNASVGGLYTPLCPTHLISPQEPQDLEIMRQVMLLLAETVPRVLIGLSTLELQPALCTLQPHALPACSFLVSSLGSFCLLNILRLGVKRLFNCHGIVLFKAGRASFPAFSKLEQFLMNPLGFSRLIT